MSAHNNGSGPRSNGYSQDRLTNWAEYEPWWLEIQAVFRRFDGRIAKKPVFPKVIELRPLTGFTRPCSAREVEAQLTCYSPDFIKDLRAIFILSGTTKQRNSWGKAATCYGHYWNRCVFLHACPFGMYDPDELRRFYIDDVLMHEIGHHVDTWNTTRKDREKFAERFVAQQASRVL